MPPSFSRALLRGLGHPSPGDVRSLPDLVEWLEHTKIRAYPPETRGPLTGQPEGLEWRAALKKYLVDVGCPREAAAGESSDKDDDDAGSKLKDEAVASWLLCHALSLSYADARDRFDDGKTSLISRQVSRGVAALNEADAAAPTAGGGPPFVDLWCDGRGAVRKACDELCSALGVAKEAGEDNDDIFFLARRLEGAEEALTERYLPAASAFAEAAAAAGAAAGAAEQKNSSLSSSTSASSFASALLDAQPLGFTTGDTLVDRGAKALRWLYVRDLSILQKSIDGALVAVQNRTANPRTDAALGKVGR